MRSRRLVNILVWKACDPHLARMASIFGRCGFLVWQGFLEATEKGPLIGSPMVGMRVVLQAGASHAVDSSEMAFRSAARGAFMQARGHWLAPASATPPNVAGLQLIWLPPDRAHHGYFSEYGRLAAHLAPSCSSP